jgi:hypothetical protein
MAHLMDFNSILSLKEKNNGNTNNNDWPKFWEYHGESVIHSTQSGSVVQPGVIKLELPWKEDCKIGYQFELKIDNTAGHCTLHPSRHRDLYYQAIGANTIGINLSKLAECLKDKKQRRVTVASRASSRNKILSDQDFVRHQFRVSVSMPCPKSIS